MLSIIDLDLSNVGTSEFEDQCLIPLLELSLQDTIITGYRGEVESIRISAEDGDNTWSQDSRHTSYKFRTPLSPHIIIDLNRMQEFAYLNINSHINELPKNQSSIKIT